MDDKKKETTSEVDWFFESKKKTVLPIAPAPDAETYKRHERRGTAIIFNHKNFTVKDCSSRLGTDKDRDDVKRLLDELKFDVFLHNDLSLAQILEVLDAVSKMDHSDPTVYCYLAGKPKLFFIQACRGNHVDPGVVVSFEETDSVKNPENVYSIPVMADFLVMYATVEGYFAWRDPENGSFFIQALVNQLRKFHRTRDLLSILTCVNREVAIGFTSYEPRCPELNNMKEMCSIVSMLTRMFYLD
ncbi:hypothetical protein JTB14_013682 [Gonioctena quinquepunctata]|nr:hypothetical protein JTB14_013682 [Gonioctena quinquepunctata]